MISPEGGSPPGETTGPATTGPATTGPAERPQVRERLDAIAEKSRRLAEAQSTASIRLYRVFIATGVVFLVSAVSALALRAAVLPVLISSTVGMATNLTAAYIERRPSLRTSSRGRRARIGAVLAFACLAVSVVAVVEKPLESRSMDVSLKLVKYDFGPGLFGALKEARDGKFNAYLNETDGYVEVNLQLALESREDAALSNVRIELSYPPNDSVDSSGIEKVSADASGKVFEHTLGAVEPGRPYQAMKAADIIHIPVKFHHAETCYLDETLMPVCTVLSWADFDGHYELFC